MRGEKNKEKLVENKKKLNKQIKNGTNLIKKHAPYNLILLFASVTNIIKKSIQFRKF